MTYFTKSTITIILLLFAFSNLFAQNTEKVRVYSKVATVNLSKIDNSQDPMAFMSNIHRPMVDKEVKRLKSGTTLDLPQKELGRTSTPTMVTSITPGPNHDGGYPYDNGIAVSTSGQVVTTTNMGVYVYDLENDLAYSSGYHAFLRSSGGKFDPQVTYDSENDRFIVVILRTGVSQYAGVDIAVTATNDPTGEWHSYFIPNSHAHPSSWIDFPHLGVSADRAYVHANIYNDSYFLESHIWDIPLEQLYAGEDISVVTHITEDSGIRFVPGANQVYGNKLYGVTISRTDAVELYVFENGNMQGPHTITTDLREGGSEFSANGKVLYPGGDANNSYSFVKDDIIYYAHAGTLFDDKEADPILIFGKLMVNPDDYAASTSSTPVYIRDGARNFSYVNTAYAGYSNEEGVAGTIITALFGSPTEYMGTIAYHVDPEENFSEGLIVAEGTAQVDTRIGDYIQAVNNPAGQNEVWISGQYGSDTEENSIFKTGENNLYLGNVIAKIHVEEVEPTDPIATSVEPASKIIEEKIFPNPAVDYCTIQFNVKDAGVYHAKLFSASGEMVSYLTSKRLKPGMVNLAFNVIPFDKGLHFVVIEKANGERLTSKKLIIK